MDSSSIDAPNARDEGEICVFRQTSSYSSETVQDMDIVSVKGE